MGVVFNLVGVISGFVWGKTQNLRVQQRPIFWSAPCLKFKFSRHEMHFNCRKDLKEENVSARPLGENLTNVSCGRMRQLVCVEAGKLEIDTGLTRGLACSGVEEGKFPVETFR